MNKKVEDVKVEDVKVKDVKVEDVKVEVVEAAVTLELVKKQVSLLSGSDKLNLFNWLKNSAGSSKAGSVKNIGVGDFVKGLIFEGFSNNEIVEKCKEKYGNEQTTYGCVVWYRNKLKKEGLV